MGLTSTTINQNSADFKGDKVGTTPSITSWVYSEVQSQSTTQTVIKYTFGCDITGNFSDGQDFDAWIDGDSQYSDSFTNDKSNGSYRYYQVNKTYNRPNYGSATVFHDARAQISGIFTGDGITNTGTKDITTGVPAKAGTTLGAPGGFNASGITSSQITYGWSAPSSSGIGPAASSYILQVALDPGFGTLVYNANVGNVGSKTITGLTRATSYWARVLAVNSVGNGAWAGTVGATTLATVPDTMSAPTVNTPTTGGFSVAFSAPNNGGSAITSYVIDVSTDNFSTVAATFTGVTSSPKVLTGLNPGVKYRARIRAINAIGGASWSASSAEIQTLGGVKVWSGSAWTEGIARSWNGSSWQVVVVRKWNGSAWVV